MRKYLLLCSLWLIASLVSLAQTELVSLEINGKNWRYTVINNEITIVGCTPQTGELNIPREIDGMLVTGIKNSAFSGQTGFSGALTIPNTIKTIGASAFAGCKNLTGSLVIPSSVTSIGNNAFIYCSGFNGNLVLPETLTSIGKEAFRECTNLRGTLHIPNTIKFIGDHTFYKCSSFDALVLSETLTSLGTGAFRECTGFRGTLNLPSTLKFIQTSAFEKCLGFSGSLNIPNSVTTIGSRAFFECTGFTGNLKISESATAIGSYAFNRCMNFTGDLVLPRSVKTIGEKAFSTCSGLNGTLALGQVTTIGSFAFEGCTKLNGTLNLPETLKTIGPSAFVDCAGFTGMLRIPNNVTSIQVNAFERCAGLTAVVFEPNTNSLTLAANIFSMCPELRYIDASNVLATAAASFTTFGQKPHTLVYLPEGSSFASTATADQKINVVLGNVCENFIAYDNQSVAATSNHSYGVKGFEYGTSIIKNFTAKNAKHLGRTFEDDYCYSMYLPYEIKLPEYVEAYSLISYRPGYLIFKKNSGTLSAYTPYLLRRVKGTGTQTLDYVVMNDVSVNVAPEVLDNMNGGNVEGWHFYGTTDPISNERSAENRLYVMGANNTWRPVRLTTASGYVRSFRVFMQAPATYSGAPMAFMLDEDDDMVTGIDDIEKDVKSGKMSIYTIDGRFVGRDYHILPAGMYIVGGKKIYKF